MTAGSQSDTIDFAQIGEMNVGCRGQILRWCRAGPLVVVIALAARAGDPDVARLLCQKAQKAYRARQYEEAEKNYRRAIAENPPCPEACYGLAETLEKLERIGDALATYRRCVDGIMATPKPSSRLKSLKSRAGRAIKRLRKRFSDLEELDRNFIQQCMRFGIRNKKKNPGAARRAFAWVLLIDPYHKEAKKLLETVCDSPSQSESPPPPKGKKLLRDDDLDDWNPGLTEFWRCKGRVLTGDSAEHSGHINWFEKERFKGSFTIQMEFRLLRGGTRRTCGLFFGNKHGKDRWWGLLVTRADELILVESRPSNHTTKKEHILRGFVPKDWNTLRVTMRPGRAVVSFNGEETFRHDSEDGDDFNGEVGVFVQDARVEYRNLVVRE
jgi:hypothetical protein